MDVRNAGTVDGFDADVALEAALSVTDDVRICVEYDTDEFNTLYADGETVALYGGEDAMNDEFAEVHSFVHLDFTERDLFEDVFLAAGRVRAFVTYMEHTIAVRFIRGDSGLFFALDPEAPVTETLDAIREALESGDDGDEVDGGNDESET